tara:strand:- start:176 stop:415 length:240 start_codon:yes stop_codon:yes gene_type:complete
MELNKKALGLSLGVVTGVGIFLVGLIGMTGYGVEIVNLIGKGYIGYSASVLGSVIGAVYGFIDGFVGGYLIAWLYNKFQ